MRVIPQNKPILPQNRRGVIPRNQLFIPYPSNQRVTPQKSVCYTRTHTTKTLNGRKNKMRSPGSASGYRTAPPPLRPGMGPSCAPQLNAEGFPRVPLSKSVPKPVAEEGAPSRNLTPNKNVGCPSSKVVRRRGWYEGQRVGGGEGRTH